MIYCRKESNTYIGTYAPYVNWALIKYNLDT